MMKVFTSLSIFLLGLCFITISSCGKSSDAPSVSGGEALPVSKRFAIDGIVDFSGQVTQTKNFTFIPGGEATTLTWMFVNDDRHLYFAAEWNDATFDNMWSLPAPPPNYDEIKLLIDDNGNQVSETNENIQLLRATFNSSFFTDGYVDASGYPDKDIIGDGLGRMLYDADRQVYQAEFLIPLIEDASGQDTNITSSTRYQIELHDSFQPTVPADNVAKLFSDGAWETIPLNDVEASYSHPQLPTNLTGLIVFVSSHEDSAGEIYTLDPATGKITRVTNNSLPEDGVSLSNDRTRIAFHAQSDASDFTSFEIYTINVDGSNQIQLTDDEYANVHPAWSPDDSKISYSPIFFAATATVVIMTSSGQFLRNITPAGIEDADAEYLPDGRIVMKTNRWNALPQLQTGVMDDFGNNVKQLTFIENVSDHDPIGNDTHVIFERYMNAT